MLPLLPMVLKQMGEARPPPDTEYKGKRGSKKADTHDLDLLGLWINGLQDRDP
jgi:hypothetical protein